MSYTNIGLVEYAYKCLNLPTIYMWGTMMNLVTDSLINSKKKQYPNNYTTDRINILKEKINNSYGCDCVGLIKSYYWGGIESPNYNSKNDFNTSMMYEAAKIKGEINNMPEKAGICLYQKGHVGIYVGNGTVIECTHSSYGDGVIKSSVNGRGWTNYFYCSEIEYVEDTPETPNISIDDISIDEIKINDLVYFKGGAHYVSSDSLSNSGFPSAGPARVTNIANGAIHPFHIIHTNSESNVYGWVDSNNITKKIIIEENNYFNYTVKSGESYWSIAENFLGNGNRYSEILKLNNRTESDPIYNGTVLKIPKE